MGPHGFMELLTQTLGQVSPTANPRLAKQIQDRLDSLTKPRGSLGRLEEIVLQYGLARGQTQLPLPRKSLFVFCADHGVTAEGVSAYPREVTYQMVRNFVSGGAAINVLCRQCGIEPVIVDMGVDHDLASIPGLVRRKVAAGTRNFLREPAMTRDQAVQSIETGIALARAAASLEFGLLGVGEMGIGNTTSASAVLAAISDQDPGELVGSGTGITKSRLQHKAEVIERSLELHKPDPADPIAVLAAVGGFEIGGVGGFCLGAATSRVAVVVDGFIASAGALLAIRLAPQLADYLFFSHQSAEPGHHVMLEVLGVKPLLSLDMRLGEGTGAALAIGVIESALRLYNEMATFESAQVSEEPNDDHIELPDNK